MPNRTRSKAFVRSRDAGLEDGYLGEIRLTWADRERGRGPAGRAIRAGQHVCSQDLRTDPDFEPWREAALRRGYAACISLPLTVDDEVFGALTIYSGRRTPLAHRMCRCFRNWPTT